MKKTLIIPLILLCTFTFADESSSYTVTTEHSDTQAFSNFELAIMILLMTSPPVNLIVVYDMENSNLSEDDPLITYITQEKFLSDTANNLCQGLISIFGNLDTFAILDRCGVEEIFKEHKLQATGVTTETIKSLGEVIGATHLLQISANSTYITKTSGATSNYSYINKLFSVETGELLSIDTIDTSFFYDYQTRTNKLQYSMKNSKFVVTDPNDGNQYYK